VAFRPPIFRVIVFQQKRFFRVVLDVDADFLVPRRSHREGFGFGDFGHMLWIAEARGRFGLRVFGERLSLSPDPAGVLGFVPAFVIFRDTRTVARLTGADPPAVAFRHSQIGSVLRCVRQALSALRRGVAALGQFAAHIPHDPFDRLGRDRLPGHVGHHDFRLPERPRRGRRDHHPQHQQRRPFPRTKPQHLPLRENFRKPSGKRGSGF
jgi:hypothetical protein